MMIQTLEKFCIECVFTHNININILPKHIQKYIRLYSIKYKDNILKSVHDILRQIDVTKYILYEDMFNIVKHTVLTYLNNNNIIFEYSIIEKAILQFTIIKYIENLIRNIQQKYTFVTKYKNYVSNLLMDMVINNLTTNNIKYDQFMINIQAYINMSIYSCKVYDYDEYFDKYDNLTLNEIKHLITNTTFDKFKESIFNNIITDNPKYLHKLMLEFINKIKLCANYSNKNTYFYVDDQNNKFNIDKNMLVINSSNDIIIKSQQLLQLVFDKYKCKIKNKKNMFRQFTTFYKNAINSNIKYLTTRYDINSSDILEYICYETNSYKIDYKQMVFIHDIIPLIVNYILKNYIQTDINKLNQFITISLQQLYSNICKDTVIQPSFKYNYNREYETKKEFVSFYNTFNNNKKQQKPSLTFNKKYNKLYDYMTNKTY